MKLSNVIGTLALSVSLAACGNKSEKAEAPQINTDAAALADLPEMMITRIPVINGKEDTSKAETVQLQTAAKIVKSSDLQAAFDSGTKISKEVSDEDLGTSTQQWFGCYGRRGGYYGYGYASYYRPYIYSGWNNYGYPYTPYYQSPYYSQYNQFNQQNNYYGGNNVDINIVNNQAGGYYTPYAGYNYIPVVRPTYGIAGYGMGGNTNINNGVIMNGGNTAGYNGGMM